MTEDEDVPRKPKALRLPSTDPLESEIQAKVVRFARSRGYYAKKFVSPGARSVPDFLFINVIGWTFFIEFKRYGKEPTESQVKEHKRIRQCNGVVFIVDAANVGIFIISLMERFFPCHLCSGDLQ